MATSKNSFQSTTPQGTDSRTLQELAQSLGARLLIPLPEQDTPLRPEEIPIGSEPVVVDGIDYAPFARIYFCTQNGETSSDEELPDLRTLSRRSDKCHVDTCMRMLIDHDAKEHKKAGFTRFEDYCNARTGIKRGRTTSFRMISEAKIALMLVANGHRVLPSQTRGIRIRTLPRQHWVPFWRAVCSSKPDGKLSERNFDEAFVHYVNRHNLPITGDEVTEVHLRPFADLSQKFSDAACCAASTEHPQTVERRKSTRRKRDRDLLKALGSELEKVFSPEQIRREKKRRGLALSQRYLTALRQESKSRTSPTKIKKLKILQQLIGSKHPELAEQIHAYMLGSFFRDVEKRVLGCQRKLKNVPRTEQIQMVKGPSIYRAVG